MVEYLLVTAAILGAIVLALAPTLASKAEQLQRDAITAMVR